jgi:hypothetical protein
MGINREDKRRWLYLHGKTFEGTKVASFPNHLCQTVDKRPITTRQVFVFNEYLGKQTLQELRLNPREPYGRHTFAGGNVFMTQLLRDTRQSLKISTPPEAFDRAIADSRKILSETQLNYLSLNIK